MAEKYTLKEASAGRRTAAGTFLEASISHDLTSPLPTSKGEEENVRPGGVLKVAHRMIELAVFWIN